MASFIKSPEGAVEGSVVVGGSPSLECEVSAQDSAAAPLTSADYYFDSYAHHSIHTGKSD